MYSTEEYSNDCIRLEKQVQAWKANNPQRAEAINQKWLRIAGYTPYQFKQTALFAKAMSKADALNHGAHEGSHSTRGPAEIMSDDFRGKLGEFCVYNWFKKHGVKCTKPSLWVDASQHKGDIGADLKANGMNIEVKSMLPGSKSLMLECAKWKNINGQVYNVDSYGNMSKKMPDMFIAVHVGTPKTTDHNYGISDYNYKDIISGKCKIHPVLTTPLTAISPDRVVKAVKTGRSRFNHYVPTSHDLRYTRVKDHGRYVSPAGEPQVLHAPNYVFPMKTYYNWRHNAIEKTYLNPKAVSNRHDVIFANGLNNGLQAIERHDNPVQSARKVVNRTMAAEDYAKGTDIHNPVNTDNHMFVPKGNVADPFNVNRLECGQLCHDKEVDADKKLLHTDWKQISYHQGKILRDKHSNVINDSSAVLKKDALSEDTDKLQHVMEASRRIPYENYQTGNVYRAVAVKLNALKTYHNIAERPENDGINQADGDVAKAFTADRIKSGVKDAMGKNVCSPAPKITYSYDNEKYRLLADDFKRDGDDVDKVRKTIASTKNGMVYFNKYTKRCNKVNDWQKQHSPKRQLERPRRVVHENGMEMQ